MMHECYALVIVCAVNKERYVSNYNILFIYGIITNRVGLYGNIIIENA